MIFQRSLSVPHLSSTVSSITCVSDLTPRRRMNAMLTVFFRSNILLSFVPAASQVVWLSSVILCGTSIMTAVILSMQYQGLRNALAVPAVRKIPAFFGVHD